LTMAVASLVVLIASSAMSRLFWRVMSKAFFANSVCFTSISCGFPVGLKSRTIADVSRNAVSMISRCLSASDFAPSVATWAERPSASMFLRCTSISLSTSTLGTPRPVPNSSIISRNDCVAILSPPCEVYLMCVLSLRRSVATLHHTFVGSRSLKTTTGERLSATPAPQQHWPGSFRGHSSQAPLPDVMERPQSVVACPNSGNDPPSWSSSINVTRSRTRAPAFTGARKRTLVQPIIDSSGSIRRNGAHFHLQRSDKREVTQPCAIDVQYGLFGLHVARAQPPVAPPVNPAGQIAPAPRSPPTRSTL